MARYKSADVLRQILEDTDEDSDTEEARDSSSEIEDHISEPQSSSSSSDDEQPDGLNTVTVTQYRGRNRGRGRARGHGSTRSTAAATASRAAVEGQTAENEVMKAKSGRIWSIVAPSVHRRGPQDIIRTSCGIRSEACIDTERTVFQLLNTPEMLDIIVRETNREAKRSHSDWNDTNPDNQRV